MLERIYVAIATKSSSLPIMMDFEEAAKLFEHLREETNSEVLLANFHTRPDVECHSTLLNVRGDIVNVLDFRILIHTYT